MLPAMGYSDIPYTLTLHDDEPRVTTWSNLLDNLKDGSGVSKEGDKCFRSKGELTPGYIRLDFGTSISVKTVYIN